jgi:hypothetical protein
MEQRTARPGLASDVAFTETVKAIQARKGSRGAYERMERNGSSYFPQLADDYLAQT